MTSGEESGHWKVSTTEEPLATGTAVNTADTGSRATAAINESLERRNKRQKHTTRGLNYLILL